MQDVVDVHFACDVHLTYLIQHASVCAGEVVKELDILSGRVEALSVHED